METTDAPLPLLMDLMASLLPDYFASAIPVATYLAPALAFRSWALRGEWQMSDALGLSPVRVMLAPVALAVLATGAQLAVRLELEPRGERVLDRLVQEIRAGAYGMSVPFAEAVVLDGATTLMADAGPGTGGAVGRVLIRRSDDVFAAGGATVKLGSQGAVVLELRDGIAVHRRGDGCMQTVRFGRFTLRADPSRAGGIGGTTGERLDRPGWSDLSRLACRLGGRIVADRRALATVAHQFSSAAFCLLLPWFAFAFGVPPRRTGGGAALLFGFLAIVAFLRTFALVEAHALSNPLAAATAHVAVWTLAASAAVRFASGHEGAWDEALRRGAVALLRRRGTSSGERQSPAGRSGELRSPG